MVPSTIIINTTLAKQGSSTSLPSVILFLARKSGTHEPTLVGKYYDDLIGDGVKAMEFVIQDRLTTEAGTISETFPENGKHYYNSTKTRNCITVTLT